MLHPIKTLSYLKTLGNFIINFPMKGAYKLLSFFLFNRITMKEYKGPAKKTDKTNPMIYH